MPPADARGLEEGARVRNAQRIQAIDETPTLATPWDTFVKDKVRGEARAASEESEAAA